MRRCRPARAAPGRRDEPPVSGPREPLTPRQDGGGAPSPLCHQLPGLASFTTRTVAIAAAVPRHPSWKGGIRASAKASSSSLWRVAGSGRMTQDGAASVIPKLSLWSFLTENRRVLL